MKRDFSLCRKFILSLAKYNKIRAKQADILAIVRIGKPSWQEFSQYFDIIDSGKNYEKDEKKN